MAEHTAQKLDGKDKRSESFGPIALTRHVKDDGRALILYTHRHDRRDSVDDHDGGDDDDDRGHHRPAEGRQA